MKRFLLLILLLIHAQIGKSQITTNFVSELYLWPAITIGYTFRNGWNYGIELTFGFTRLENTYPPTALGLNLQSYIVNYKSERHHITAFNLVADNPIANFGFGAGIISKTWGFKRVNKDRAIGLSATFNLSTGNYKFPWQGIKVFVPSDSWTWSSLPYYLSYHIYWRQEAINLKQ